MPRTIWRRSRAIETAFAPEPIPSALEDVTLTRSLRCSARIHTHLFAISDLVITAPNGAVLVAEAAPIAGVKMLLLVEGDEIGIVWWVRGNRVAPHVIGHYVQHHEQAPLVGGSYERPAQTQNWRNHEFVSLNRICHRCRIMCRPILSGSSTETSFPYYMVLSRACPVCGRSMSDLRKPKLEKCEAVNVIPIEPLSLMQDCLTLFDFSFVGSCLRGRFYSSAEVTTSYALEQYRVCPSVGGSYERPAQTQNCKFLNRIVGLRVGYAALSRFLVVSVAYGTRRIMK